MTPALQINRLTFYVRKTWNGKSLNEAAIMKVKIIHQNVFFNFPSSLFHFLFFFHLMFHVFLPSLCFFFSISSGLAVESNIPFSCLLSAWWSCPLCNISVNFNAYLSQIYIFSAGKSQGPLGWQTLSKLLVSSFPTISHTLSIWNFSSAFSSTSLTVCPFSSPRIPMFWWCQTCTLPASTGWRSRSSQQRVKVQRPPEPSRLLGTKAPWSTVSNEWEKRKIKNKSLHRAETQPFHISQPKKKIKQVPENKILPLNCL